MEGFLVQKYGHFKTIFEAEYCIFIKALADFKVERKEMVSL